MFGLQLTSECWRCSLFMNRVQGHQVETTREPSRTEAGKLVTGDLSLVIGHLEGDTAKRRLRQSPITSDQLPVTSEPPLVQSPNARPELEVGATQEQCPGSTGISSDKSRSCPNSPAGCRRSQRGLACAFGAGLLACLGNVAYYHALNLGGKASTVAAL